MPSRTLASPASPAASVFDEPEVQAMQRGFRVIIRAAIGAGEALGLDHPEIQDVLRVAFHNAVEPGCIAPDDQPGSPRLRRLAAYLTDEFGREIDRTGIDRDSDFFGPGGEVYGVYGRAAVAVYGEFGGLEAWR